MIPVFPPTRTDSFDRCNILDYFENEVRWVPKQASRKLIGGLAGRAFALGVSEIHKGALVAYAVDQAIKLFDADMRHFIAYGVSFDVSIEEIILASGIANSITKYALADPFKGWSIQHVEHRLPEQGRCVIDLGGLDTDGVLAVADVKYKQNLDARYKSNTVDEYLTSWQFMHYPWAYGEYMQKPCHRMYLCLVVNKPKFSVELIQHEIHPETAQIWLTSAKAKWARMADLNRQPEMSTRHKDTFGMCPFYKACFDYHLDEGLMQRDYVKVPRREIIV
jgi:hypothetical protein